MIKFDQRMIRTHELLLEVPCSLQTHFSLTEIVQKYQLGEKTFSTIFFHEKVAVSKNSKEGTP